MSEPLCPKCDDTGRRESEWEPSLSVPCECGGSAVLDSAAAIMAEATSWFVQESYAREGMDALLAAGWTLTPPDDGRPLADHERSRCTAGHVRQMAEEYEALEAEVDRLRAEVDFWDYFHDEAFPNDPLMSGAMRAEVERLRAMRDGTATPVSTCDCPPPYAECPHPPAPGPPSEAKRPCVVCDKPTMNVCGDWGDEYEGEPMCRPCTEQYWEDLHG